MDEGTLLFLAVAMKLFTLWRRLPLAWRAEALEVWADIGPPGSRDRATDGR